MIDVAHHQGLIDAQGDIFSDYFCLHILQGITKWETTIEPWDLVCYSVPRNIGCLQTRDSVPVVGFFRHKNQIQRWNFMQAMLGSVPGLTVNWTVVTLGHGGSLASQAEYQALLEASTKDKDSNPDLMIRVDVLGSSEAPPKKRGFAPGHRPPRPPLAALDSLLNAIGTTALPGVRTLADPAAKTTASRAEEQEDHPRRTKQPRRTKRAEQKSRKITRAGQSSQGAGVERGSRAAREG